MPRTSSLRYYRSQAAGLCAAASLLALSACAASGEGRDQGVASLASAVPEDGGSGTTTPTAGAIEAARPQLRLDSTEEEVKRLRFAYWACLETHGVKMDTARVGTSKAQAPPLQSGPNSHEPAEAYRACLVKMPLMPPELDRDRNPDYVVQHHAYVKCLKAHGMHVTELPDASGWTYADNDQPAESVRHKIDKDCKMEVFGGRN
ncbi:hypothetical protein [Planotetraspora kaengkrachanensis]|uniref:Lipoprotein n=1 Tax=Planotetraspora kaengkrachanensis TaxID=575193 RepID=A0A8J3PYU4_9ACTN|nr:hypothetical protein [Planotetraspora kaengkrachanensis]GIG83604.1 hypothetical protein Pka01_67310 [Planotetraspora kaengkrachanensis]